LKNPAIFILVSVIDFFIPLNSLYSSLSSCCTAGWLVALVSLTQLTVHLRSA